MDISNLLAKVYELLTVYGLKVVAAIVIFIVGRWVAKAVSNFIKKVMTKSKADGTLVSFVGAYSGAKLPPIPFYCYHRLRCIVTTHSGTL